jgi:mRNA turnover protein 4
MPTSLKKGIVHLEKEFTVCKKGDKLTPEQAKILKLLDIKMSDFHLNLISVWSKGKIKKFLRE